MTTPLIDDIPTTLAEAGLRVLGESDARRKALLSRSFAALWRDGRLANTTDARSRRPSLLDRPARPAAPELLPATKMPRRKSTSSVPGRTALLHALAHIELNAVDLYWDIIVRFDLSGENGQPLPERYFADLVSVADDEGRHFLMLDTRLEDLGSHYGALPAHDGLWQASMDTAGDLAARLAIVPMVLEARGLDVTPAMIENLRTADDGASADIIQVIHDDEIRHVSVGRHWFEFICETRGDTPIPTWQALVKQYFRGPLKRPFNTIARSKAGFHTAFYEPIAID